MPLLTAGRWLPVLAVAAALAPPTSSSSRLDAEVLESVAALPPALVGRFHEPLAFQQADSGSYFVFDRRDHAVYRIDERMETATRLLSIGQEPGNLLLPFAFDLGPGELFAVGDAPGGQRERVQIFDPAGYRVGGFSLPGRAEARVQLEGLVLNGIGSLQFTAGHTILVSQPETGSLISEYDVTGRMVNAFGRLRPTGHEADEDLHLALNSGLPLEIPGGGYYFVFQAGAPAFHRYGADGRLVYERVIQGRDIDDLLRVQPTRWPRRTGLTGREIPVVTPVVRTAAVAPDGSLWVSITVGVTYVYDPDGEKVRIVGLRGAGPLMPTSLSFTGDGRLLVTPGGFVFRP